MYVSIDKKVCFISADVKTYCFSMGLLYKLVKIFDLLVPTVVLRMVAKIYVVAEKAPEVEECLVLSI